MTAEIALVTPTRGRPEAFEFCALWMSRQTFLGKVQWVIVDDGDIPINPDFIGAMRFARWKIDYIRRSPPEVAETCTLQANLLAALDVIDAPNLLVIEDDEFYAPIYIEEMLWRLRDADLVGECAARYYNVQERRWGIMKDNTKHASLCRTGLNASILPILKTITEISEKKQDPFIDMKLWAARQPAVPVLEMAAPTPADRPWAVGAQWKRPAAAAADPSQLPIDPAFPRLPATVRSALFENRGISIGIKGMPGRAGVGGSHGSRALKNADPSWAKLIEWIGSDAQTYMFLAQQRGWQAVP